MTTVRDRWWPEIRDVDTARRVARQAFWAAIFVAGMTVLFASLAAFGKPLAGTTPLAFLDAALFGLIAGGIWHMSRVAAVAGLVVFGFEKIMMARENPKGGGMIVAIILLIAFANGIRATFAYHRLRRPPPVSVEAPPLAPR